MGADQRAKELGLEFPKKEKGYLNHCVRTGNLLITSGHVSDMKGKLGAALTVAEGYQAARTDCRILTAHSRATFPTAGAGTATTASSTCSETSRIDAPRPFWKTGPS